MRKNIYNDNIIMFTYDELNDITCSKYISEEERMIMMDCLHNAFPIGIIPKTDEEYIGINKDDEIIEIAKKYFEKVTKQQRINIEDLKNAYLYSIMFDDEFASIKDAIKRCTRAITVSDFIFTYGEDVYDYVMSHKNYSYEKNYDPVLLNDLNIFLYENGISKEIETVKEESYRYILSCNQRKYRKCSI